MRLIDADEAVKIMACEMYAEAQSQGYDADGIEDFIPEAKAWINDAPTIDAVSVVRCKECKNWKWIEWAKEYRCILRNTAFNAKADDFCSYGERKDKCKECWYWSEVYKRCENKCGCQFKPYEERKESE